MSDRRPSKLYVLGPYRRDGHGFGYPEKREASSSDLLAAVRRGVESGEIKGEVVDVSRMEADASGTVLLVTHEAGTYLVIPISDAGEQ